MDFSPLQEGLQERSVVVVLVGMARQEKPGMDDMEDLAEVDSIDYILGKDYEAMHSLGTGMLSRNTDYREKIPVVDMMVTAAGNSLWIEAASSLALKSFQISIS